MIIKIVFKIDFFLVGQVGRKFKKKLLEDRSYSSSIYPQIPISPVVGVSVDNLIDNNFIAKLGICNKGMK